MRLTLGQIRAAQKSFPGHRRHHSLTALVNKHPRDDAALYANDKGTSADACGGALTCCSDATLETQRMSNLFVRPIGDRSLMMESSAPLPTEEEEEEDQDQEGAQACA